jgi:hypothetical protein
MINKNKIKNRQNFPSFFSMKFSFHASISGMTECVWVSMHKISLLNVPIFPSKIEAHSWTKNFSPLFAAQSREKKNLSFYSGKKHD